MKKLLLMLSLSLFITSLPVLSEAKGNSGVQMTLIKSGNNQLDISYTGNDSVTQRISFVKTAWGTWNIGSWHKAGILVAGANTDWEYVFRVTDSPGKNYEFSGGNHGKEKLTGIRIMTDNADINVNRLKPGEKLRAGSLILCEHTTLNLDNAFTRPYADVVRTYTITPSKIALKTTFAITSEVYMGTSYVCMFPIPKDKGRYIKFLGSGNLYETPALGRTLTKEGLENLIGKEKTLAAEIWGASNPQNKFIIAIDNEDMVDHFNNELKVFYWDMNKSSNKLYFSKFDSSHPRKIEKGTQWTTKASWSLESASH